MDSEVKSEISNLDHLADRSSWSLTIDDVYILGAQSLQVTKSLETLGGWQGSLSTVRPLGCLVYVESRKKMSAVFSDCMHAVQNEQA